MVEEAQTENTNTSFEIKPALKQGLKPFGSYWGTFQLLSLLLVAGGSVSLVFSLIVIAVLQNFLTQGAILGTAVGLWALGLGFPMMLSWVKGVRVTSKGIIFKMCLAIMWCSLCMILALSAHEVWSNVGFVLTLVGMVVYGGLVWGLVSDGTFKTGIKICCASPWTVHTLIIAVLSWFISYGVVHLPGPTWVSQILSIVVSALLMPYVMMIPFHAYLSGGGWGFHSWKVVLSTCWSWKVWSRLFVVYIVAGMLAWVFLVFSPMGMMVYGVVLLVLLLSTYQSLAAYKGWEVKPLRSPSFGVASQTVDEDNDSHEQSGTTTPKDDE